MERNIQRNGLVNLLALLAVGVSGFIVARYSDTAAGMLCLVFIGLGLLVALVSWFQMRLEESERVEKLELEELAKGHASSAMFEAKDAEIFPAQRAREQFERFFVPVFTIVLFLLEAAGAYFGWRWLSKPAILPELKQPTTALALFGLFALILFLLGKFSATMARLENNRLLRPSASYLLLGAYLSAAVAAGIVGIEAGAAKGDYYVACALCVLLGLIAAETLVNLLLEMYRPRVRGKIGRPLYESRLVGLLGQPEGLITTAAEALDYQFGFNVSQTWFYRLFVEKALAWLIVLQLGALWLSTLVVFIDAGEQGLLERFGRPVKVLNPGTNFKLPWPIDQVYRSRTEQIQMFEIGTAPEENREEEHIVLWTVAHNKEENFLVANREEPRAAASEGVKRSPPVSFLTGTIPVQFQITNLTQWAYNNEDSQALLQDLASREIVRFLAAVDMTEVMSYGRLEAGLALRDNIQSAANARGMGAKVVAVGLQDLHPPVKVAPEYEKVIGAMQTKQAKILAARADEIKTNALASAQATNILNKAVSYAVATEIGALARAALFTNQIPAYKAAPSVYPQLAYLQSFVRATADARKYIILTTNAQNVLTFDLQDKFRPDIYNDVTVAPPKK